MIRVAGQPDAAAIAAIYALEVLEGTATFEVEPPKVAEIARRMAVGEGRLAWLVWNEADMVLGYAYASAYRARAAYDRTVETTIFVARGAQGRGVGRRLYDALIERLIAAGFTQALGVIALPNAASVALHEATGFRQVARLERVGCKFGRWLDGGYWQRGLAAEQG